MVQYLDFAIDTVREIGSILVATDQNRIVLSDSIQKGPLVVGDIYSHDLFAQKIRDTFPDHSLLSEEGSVPRLSRFLWVCDPICGTYNYSRRIPYFAVSLSLVIDGEIVVAVIYNPESDELFHATRGHGSYLNSSRIKTSGVSQLDRAIVCFNSNFSHPPDQRIGERMFSLLCPPVTARLRLTESANLDLAYVACGRYDAYLHPSDKVWDKTAGKLIVEEAGGLVHDFSRANKFSLENPGVIATNGLLSSELESVISVLLS